MTTSTVRPGMRAATGHASPYTPIAVINGTPIYAVRGGRSGGGIKIAVGSDDGEDPDLDEDDDEDEDDEPDEDDDPGAEDEDDDTSRGKRKPGQDGNAAMARMEAALKKANGEAAKNRRAGKAMQRLGIDDFATWLTERGIDPDTGLPYGEDVVDPTDDGEDDLRLDEPAERQSSKTRDRETVRAVRTAVTQAEARAREVYVPILAQQAATLALREAGFKGSRAKLDRVLRLIDPNDLDVVLDGDEFEIEGMDDAIASIQDEFPELFTANGEDDGPVRRTAKATTGTGRPRAGTGRATRGARDVDGGERGRPAKKQGGWIDQVVAQMDKRGR